jgi:uncharacterized membrane protein YczE
MKTMEAKGHLEVMAMSRFIPLMVPLLPLKLMVRSWLGVTPIGAFLPPLFGSPQAVIDPSALRAAKAS